MFAQITVAESSNLIFFLFVNCNQLIANFNILSVKTLVAESKKKSKKCEIFRKAFLLDNRQRHY